MDIKILECTQFFKLPCEESVFIVDPFKLRIFYDSMNLGNWGKRENICQGNIKEELLLLNDGTYLNSETNCMIYGLNFSPCIFENFRHMYVQKNAFVKWLSVLMKHLFQPHVVRMIWTTSMHLEWIFDQKLKGTKSPLLTATPNLVSMKSKLHISVLE